jgi:hypothetical protein
MKTWTVIAALTLTVGCVRAPRNNAELKQIYDADQSDREGKIGAPVDWEKISPHDAARRKRVRELLDAGAVVTGKDYELAAMVFQHGDGTDDILFAHILAMTAMGKGDKDARWLAAASLDRFLQRAGQPQVFGTQFNYTQNPNGSQLWTMDPYNRTLVSSALRAANCVPDQTHQASVLDAFKRGEEPQPPSNPPCNIR